MFCRGQEHRGVAIMAAGVHQSRMAAGIGQAGGLVDRKRIHVGPQAQFAGAGAASQLPHHSGAGQATGDGISPALEPVSDEVAGAKLLEADFRMLVDVAAQRREGVCARMHRRQCSGHRITAVRA
jgi:hypothetical protein